jgi:hypothetical protein
MGAPDPPLGNRNAPLAEGKWQLVDKYLFAPIAELFRKRPVLATVLVIVILVAITVIWQKQVSFENDVFAFRVRGTPSMESSSLKSCIARGYGRKSYIILSAFMTVRVEDDSEHKIRHSYFRTVYTILPLTDKVDFKEEYDAGSSKPRVEHWWGPEEETLESNSNDSSSIYFVKFPVEKGTPYTLLTGADYKYALPLPGDRKALSETLTLPSNEEFYSYPNTDDYICELSISIESPTTNFSPGQHEAALRHTVSGQTANTEKSVAHFATNDMSNSAGNKGSIAAHWTDVQPSEEVGIHFTW